MGKTIYQANCVEWGESFFAYFKTSEKDQKKLEEIGRNLAVGWGAELVSVIKADDQSVTNVKEVQK